MVPCSKQDFDDVLFGGGEVVETTQKLGAVMTMRSVMVDGKTEALNIINSKGSYHFKNI